LRLDQLKGFRRDQERQELDSLRTFTEAGYGGVTADDLVGLGDINATPQILPADAGSVLSPKRVTQDFANDGVILDRAGVWQISISFSLAFVDVNNPRDMLMDIFHPGSGTSLGATLISIGRNQAGTNFSVTLLGDIPESVVGELLVCRVASAAHTFTTVTMVGYSFEFLLVDNAEGFVPPPPDGPSIEVVTLDPLFTDGDSILLDNNLTFSGREGVSGWGNSRATIPRSAHKVCWEVTNNVLYNFPANQAMTGICEAARSPSGYFGDTDGDGWSVSNDVLSDPVDMGRKYFGDTPTGARWYPAGETVMICLDPVAGTLGWSQGGGVINNFFNIASGEYYAGVSGDGANVTVNFGATPFVHTIPPGYFSYDGNQAG
jgi:hypothetical protein